MTLIHVIIPVYNAKKYLQKTVDSILKQPCSSNIDILLIDDGSNDGSEILCDELQKQNANVYILHQKNSGVSCARNVGIDFYKDKEDGWICFLDADDLWNENVFDDKMCDYIKAQEEADVLVFGGSTSNEEESRFSLPRMYEPAIINGGNSVIWKMQGHFCANLYRLSMLRKWNIRFSEGLKYSEDKIFMMQSGFLASKVEFMPQLLHIYRQNAKSAMGISRKISAIEYYIPIIEGWVASDMFLNILESKTNKSTDAGIVLAGIYFGDMAREHYKNWGSAKELEKVKQHPYYYLYETMNPNCVTKKQYNDCKLFRFHPILYKAKYNAIGILEYFVKCLLFLKPVYKYRNLKKYPLNREQFIERVK